MNLQFKPASRNGSATPTLMPIQFLEIIEYNVSVNTLLQNARLWSRKSHAAI